MKTYLSFVCKQCNKNFTREKKNCHGNPVSFCSRKCTNESYRKGNQIKCANCNSSLYVPPSYIKKSKSGNCFCSRSCSTTFNNKNKKHGIRRSKLEDWIEVELCKRYPELEIHFNKKCAINSELDIYFPLLKFAVELNGIFHYEPIFGADKLRQIQNNDNRKYQACLERGIELCIIDTSGLGQFNDAKAQKYLDIIVSILESKLSHQ